MLEFHNFDLIKFVLDFFLSIKISIWVSRIRVELNWIRIRPLKNTRIWPNTWDHIHKWRLLLLFSSFVTVEKNPYILLLVFPQTLWKSFNLSTLWKKMQFKPTLYQGRTILLDFCWEGAIRPFRGDFDEFPCRFICLNYIIWSHKIFIYWSCFKVK